jgi:hypothetical protein
MYFPQRDKKQAQTVHTCCPINNWSGTNDNTNYYHFEHSALTALDGEPPRL